MWDYIYKCNEIFIFGISCLPNILVSWFRTWNSGCLMDVRSRLYVRFSFTLKLYDCILSFHGKHTKWKCFAHGIKMIIIDILLVSSIIIIFYNNFDVGNLTEQAHCMGWTKCLALTISQAQLLRVFMNIVYVCFVRVGCSSSAHLPRQ